MGDHSAATPTQIQFPTQAIKRTLIQVIIPAAVAFGLVVPEIIRAILEGYGELMPAEIRVWLLGAAAVVVATAGVLAKIMALPRVDTLLKRWGAATTPRE